MKVDLHIFSLSSFVKLLLLETICTLEIIILIISVTMKWDNFSLVDNEEEKVKGSCVRLQYLQMHVVRVGSGM